MGLCSPGPEGTAGPEEGSGEETVHLELNPSWEIAAVQRPRGRRAQECSRPAGWDRLASPRRLPLGIVQLLGRGTDAGLLTQGPSWGDTVGHKCFLP